MSNTASHQGERKPIDCVEIYLPKSIELLSGLYLFLQEKVSNPLGPVPLEGFSIYEVDGVFRGQQLWEQRTLVIRLMFPRHVRDGGSAIQYRISLLGSELATRVAPGEEEIWICHYVQTLTVFWGVKRLLV
jgi:hypothetical protein